MGLTNCWHWIFLYLMIFLIFSFCGWIVVEINKNLQLLHKVSCMKTGCAAVYGHPRPDVQPLTFISLHIGHTAILTELTLNIGILDDMNESSRMHVILKET